MLCRTERLLVQGLQVPQMAAQQMQQVLQLFQQYRRHMLMVQPVVQGSLNRGSSNKQLLMMGWVVPLKFMWVLKGCQMGQWQQQKQQQRLYHQQRL